MEEKSELSVVIDGKVYRLSGGSDIYLQKLASYVDGKISITEYAAFPPLL